MIISNQCSIKDCIIIGAGPAGLTAAIYLKRFRRNIAIIDNSQSRAALIPLSHNYPGLPEGISGTQLLKQLRQQLNLYQGEIISNTVSTIQFVTENHFLITASDFQMAAKKVILATGVVDIEPALPDLNDAIKRGLIRHCPVCDGYEVIDQKIGVIGYGGQGLREALFMRTYSKDITLLTLGKAMDLTNEEQQRLTKAKIKIVLDSIARVKIESSKIIGVITIKDEEYIFDTIYSALGAKIRSDLAIQLGAEHLDNQCLVVDRHQRTSIPGFYAVGDIVSGLNQICVATGQAAIAATDVHNSLSENNHARYVHVRTSL